MYRARALNYGQMQCNKKDHFWGSFVSLMSTMYGMVRRVVFQLWNKSMLSQCNNRYLRYWRKTHAFPINRNESYSMQYFSSTVRHTCQPLWISNSYAMSLKKASSHPTWDSVWYNQMTKYVIHFTAIIYISNLLLFLKFFCRAYLFKRSESSKKVD